MLEKRLKDYKTIKRISFKGHKVTKYVPFDEYVHFTYEVNPREKLTVEVYYDDVEEQDGKFVVIPHFRKEGKGSFYFVESAEIEIEEV